jgi:alkylation response protein AidB-like acyl-CoA dehydrogenase
MFDFEHEHFRSSVAAFLAAEAVPHVERWEKEGMVDRGFWRKAAGQGLVGLGVPEQYGGAGVRDFRFNVVLDEEVAYANAIGDNFSLQNDIICPYLLDLTTAEQRERWLPKFVSGDLVAAIAMSEPGMGSDLRAMTSTARNTADGYLLNGSKTFVTSGIQADLVIVAAQLHRRGEPDGMVLLAVDRDAPGFTRGRKLRKVGRLAQDTAELFFEDVEVPRENLIGLEGHGLEHLKHNLPQERLSIAVMAVAVAETALAITITYCRERRSFDTVLGGHQVVRFYLAEMRTELDVARAYLDRCIEAHLAGELTAAEAAGTKYWTTDLQGRVVDQCVQLHGGYGYMEEYPIARIWRDSRVQRIYGGSNEIMKDIVGRAMQLAPPRGAT